MAPPEKPVRLFSRTSQAIVYNFKANPVQRMLDFDYLCKRETPSIGALVTPGTREGSHKVFFGTKEVLLPVYGSTAEAAQAASGADVFINFASFRSAAPAANEALDCPTIKTVVIIAEGIPESDVRRLIVKANRLGKTIIGGATVGGVQAGAFKIGDTAGTVENIIACKLYRPGSVGFVSKSGGLSNEMYNILARATDGLYEGLAIGGDSVPGSTLLDHCLRFEAISEIKMIVILGELGGTIEYEIADALKAKKITKPLLAWVSGTCAAIFPTEVQFGHAGAKSGGSTQEGAHAKNKALREAGALTPTSFEDFEALIGNTFKDLVAKGVVHPNGDFRPPEVPDEFLPARAKGRVRRATGVVSSICDDRGEEPTYAGIQISQLIEENATLGDVVSLLWFKRRLPKYATRFIEMCLILTADHGPCVSGAHNAIIASRAGKDLVSCLCSGLLTIGPRFGGAIDDAARYFKSAIDRKMTPQAFVDEMKNKGIRIPGIGHRIKSATNRDKRVLILQQYAREHFPSTKNLKFAEDVETVTLQKAANLVLNVDGCIGVLFLDLMKGCAAFSSREIHEIVETGYLNAFFVLGRSIGFLGHAIDQKRLHQPLYRHPWDDVCYLE
eukprot:TRINITY_DN28774_c0_g1_i1.p1 TRINITY_DN28774_c0_g1~~TRINITY_DN28774_c0_g1_i1.p1  ORF type:complete len:627 (+),score=132.38 TRINITY_DN28774_c0_g1_i1:39-1883(+)